jgi:hypothetical protein
MKLEPAFRWELAGHPIGNGLEMALGFRLELDMPREGLDSSVLERKLLRTDGAHELDWTNVVRLLGENEVAPHGAFPRLDVAQDRVACLSLV